MYVCHTSIGKVAMYQSSSAQTTWTFFVDTGSEKSHILPASLYYVILTETAVMLKLRWGIPSSFYFVDACRGVAVKHSSPIRSVVNESIRRWVVSMDRYRSSVNYRFQRNRLKIGQLKHPARCPCNSSQFRIMTSQLTLLHKYDKCVVCRHCPVQNHHLLIQT